MAETNPIPEILAPTGLSVCFSGVWQEIPYTWADNLYGMPSRAFAKYLFTFTDAEQWNQWEQWGDNFVTEVIEPVYFQQVGDISWNLYWVSVLKEAQFNQIDTQQKIAFSSNTEYTRNLMVPLERLEDFIPVGRIQAYLSSKEVQLPDEIWMNQLEPKGLSFCLEEFAQKTLDAYVGGTSVDRKTSPESGKLFSQSQKFDSLRSISIPRDFRRHYYSKDWNIDFQGVNLLYGPNGAGKTSLLSAIELALTGEVRHLSKTKDPSIQAEVILTANVDGANVEVHPPRTSAKKKDVEQKFYKSRSGKRFAPRLQSLFHQFNYLSVEETFLFANQQPDLSDIFSKLLYGPETNDMWHHLMRYKEECQRSITALEKEAADWKSKIQKLPETSPASKEALRAYISASGLLIDPDGPPEDILFKAQSALAAYDKVRDCVPVLPQEHLQRELAKQEAHYQTLEKEMRKLAEELPRTEEREKELLRKKTEIKNICRTIENSLASLQALEPFIIQLQFSVDHQAQLAQYQMCRSQQLALEKTAAQLQQFEKQYKMPLENPPSCSKQQIREQTRNLQKERLDLKKDSENLQSQIDAELLLQEKRTQLFSELRAAGLGLYQMDEQRGECPLCGTKGITQEILTAHLEKEAVQGSQLLQTLYQEKQEKDEKLRTAESSLKQLGREAVNIQNYEDAMTIIHPQFPAIQNITDLRREYDNCTELLNAAKGQVQQAKRSLQEVSGEKNLEDTIAALLESRKQLIARLQPALISISSNASDQEIINTIVLSKAEWSKSLTEQQALLSQTETASAEQSEAVKLCKSALEETQGQLEQAERILQRLKSMGAFWESVKPILNDSTLTGEAVQTLCLHIRDSAQAMIESEKSKKEQQQYGDAVACINQKVERCRMLQRELTALRPLDTYAEQFISQNITQISRIFLALHSPQEFSGLGMTADKQLAAFRNQEVVPVSHMSTGQRTALVIAVFFQMNLATASVPNFLLLDEPVANIDDLNVLALMDFLRELAITHKKQIFFTTANRNVAKLFRRKFSFLLRDFQELCFNREKEHSLRIIQRSYNESRLFNSEEL